ncbi:MAG: hypothetical protein M3133_04415, partial [Actinomycetota bacterium]|nr:hypothetical protein [Actinomycetota bacterium]
MPGLHPVRELLLAHLAGRERRTLPHPGGRAGPSPRAVLVAKDRRSSRVLFEILELAEQAGVPVRVRSRAQLEALAGEVSNQGVVAVAPPYRYLRFEELIEAVPP